MDAIHSASNQLECDLVYFIQAGNFVKIGRTSVANLSKRISQIQNGCPEEAFLVVTLNSPPFQERHIHHELRNSRYRGEWFRLTAEVKCFVRQALVLERRHNRESARKVALWQPPPIRALAVLPLHINRKAAAV